MFAIKPFPTPGITVNRPWTVLRKRLLKISFEEVTFDRRGFDCDRREVRERLEHIGQTFLLGYHRALNDEGPEVLASYLNRTNREFCGFAYEGAAMGLALLDQLSLRNHTRLLTFLEGVGSKHIYMVHVGVGWAIARVPWLRWNLNHAIAPLDSLLRWLAVDGVGFNDFYFNAQSLMQSPERLNRLRGYARHAYAQGVGRSLWFVTGANADRITRAITALPPPLHGDLWSGIGVACAMAGGGDRVTIESLRAAAGVHKAALAQGAAFAAKARQLADSPTDHTEIACQIIAGLDAATAARLTDEMLRDLPEDGEVPAYEIWRQRIQSVISHYSRAVQCL